MEKIETIEQKGYRIDVYPDYDAESPDYWHDGAFFLVGFHDQFSVSRRDIDRDTLRAIACGGKYESGEDHSRALELMKAYRVYRLDARIYSSADNPHLMLKEELTGARTVDEAYGEYDSFYFGAAFISRREAPDEKTALERAAGLLKEWDDYLRGNVYRYTLTDPDGEIATGCGGFYGYPYTEMLEEAKAELKAHKKERDTKRAGVAAELAKFARIYDNGGATLDRYTAIYDGACYGFSDDPASPQGFNQYCGAADKIVEKDNAALGKRIAFKKLPLAVREALINRAI